MNAEGMVFGIYKQWRDSKLTVNAYGVVNRGYEEVPVKRVGKFNCIDIRTNKGIKTVPVYKLVGDVFFGTTKVRHIGNTLDDRIDNLIGPNGERRTIEDIYRERWGGNKRAKKPSGCIAIRITMEDGEVIECDTILEASEILDASSSTVSAWSRKHQKHPEFGWLVERIVREEE